MSKNVIEIENLYKEYRLGLINSGYLIKDIQSWWARIRGKEDPNSLINTHSAGNLNNGTKSFLALNDVSLEVQEGEVLGIIGRNGAGKSTLLKILSRVTAPTKGQVKIRGRVGSLLEVGTGFHPELTGRDNIFLNGAVLGMRKQEIERKFDEIVAFSEIEKFIDTPVKRYSSGMYVRLAFAVAAHLDTEILIVDEVLAVGDAEFQKKCLGKMGDVSKEGRTVLFVSHNIAAVKNLCKKCILLNSGQMEMEGTTNDVVNYYLENSSAFSHGESQNPVLRQDDMTKKEKPYIKQVCIRDKFGKIANTFSSTDEIHVELQIEPNPDLDGRINAFWHLYDANANNLAAGVSFQMQHVLYPPETDSIKFVLYPEPLVPGDYSLGFNIVNFRIKQLDLWERAIKFKISENDYNKTGFNYPGFMRGEIFVNCKWDNN
jgi:lipopolysaccharide transport system ATP-binding protein